MGQPLMALPGERDLPYEDGEPMETGWHAKAGDLLGETLTLAWKDRDDFFVGVNMGIYFSAHQIKNNDFRAPDFFVVLDTERKEHFSWVVWEQLRTPSVVIEFLSDSTASVDRGKKMGIYARALHVPEYFLYDPETGTLEGYRLDPQTRWYVPMEPEPDGTFLSTALNLKLGLWEGAFWGIHHTWARWRHLDGTLLPTGAEMAEQERVRAEQERVRAEQEHVRAEQERVRAEQERVRAEQERARAERAEAELAELRALLKARTPSEPADR